MNKYYLPAQLRQRLNEIQQEVLVGTWDNVLLALTLFILGISITLMITGLSNISPTWFLIILISFMILWFVLQNFSLLLDSIFSKKNRFTGKSKFISFILALFLFLVLLIGLPYGLFNLLEPDTYEKYFSNNSIGFYVLAVLIYTIPIVLGFCIYPKIKKFFKNNCPTLILRAILSVKKENQKELLKHWKTSLSELRKLDKEY